MLQTMKMMEKIKPNDQFISSIRVLHSTMNFLGAWPRPNSKMWYNFIWYLHSLGLVFLWFGLIAGLIVHGDNTRIIIDSLGLVIPCTCIFIKWITFARCKKSIEELVFSMKGDWSNLKSNNMVSGKVPESKSIMMNYAKTARIFFFTFVTIMALGITNYVRDCVAARNSRNSDTDLHKLLPMPYSWYPLDYNRRSNIEFLVVFQTITAATLSLANGVIDNLFVTVTLHLCGQFRILRCFIEGITYDPSRPEYCEAKVRLMATRHQELLRMGKRIQDSFNIIILEQLVACTLTICFLGYAVIAELEKSEANSTFIMKTGLICGATLLTIFSYCYVGDHLSSHSIAIAMAIYNAEWYTCTRSINLSFLIVMIRAERPVEITGAKLLPMSLESFTVILRAAASYLSVLRRVSVGET